ncbi:MAG TPA: hypothetical protein V6D14_07690 [Coleofasciculaceae cyanobacterium]
MNKISKIYKRQVEKLFFYSGFKLGRKSFLVAVADSCTHTHDSLFHKDNIVQVVQHSAPVSVLPLADASAIPTLWEGLPDDSASAQAVRQRLWRTPNGEWEC